MLSSSERRRGEGCDGQFLASDFLFTFFQFRSFLGLIGCDDCKKFLVLNCLRA
uniref:Uncharacterized protein n=1 Tax=Kalanchoe fedtschenkoi TaxID=63787 RepID=A0A7N0UMS6_KALFE